MTDEPFGGIGKKYNENGEKRHKKRRKERERERGNINKKTREDILGGLFRDLCGVYASSFEYYQLLVSFFSPPLETFDDATHSTSISFYLLLVVVKEIIKDGLSN